MDSTLHEEVKMLQKRQPICGQQLFEVVTSGMYDIPLMVYREYVQNAVDSIDSAIEEGLLNASDGHINIEFQGANRSITIEDNGTGVSNKEAEERLCSIGHSLKHSSKQRGFRGIGRLGGIAYCDLLRFETRSAGDKLVAVVEWDNRRLKGLLESSNRRKSLVQTVRAISSVSYRNPNEDDPEHFFRVTMENIHPFHRDVLVVPKDVYRYLSQVAPVPYDDSKFSFSNRLVDYFLEVPGYRNYDICLDGQKIYRPYRDLIPISAEKNDKIIDIRLFEFPNINGGCLFRGWYAITDFLGSYPSSVTMRGIRVRQGNIEVGDEHFLEEYFKERRFATWHIGEIHIFDDRIKQNARRDGFEQSPEYERFLEHAFCHLGPTLSNLCRQSSVKRNLDQKISKKLSDIDRMLDPQNIYIDEDHFQDAISQANIAREEIEALTRNRNNGDIHERLQNIRLRISNLSKDPYYLTDLIDGRSIRHMDRKVLIQELCREFHLSAGNGHSSQEIIRKAISPYLKQQG